MTLVIGTDFFEASTQGKIKDAIRSKNYEEAQNLKKQRDSIVKEVAEARQVAIHERLQPHTHT